MAVTALLHLMSMFSLSLLLSVHLSLPPSLRLWLLQGLWLTISSLTRSCGLTALTIPITRCSGSRPSITTLWACTTRKVCTLLLLPVAPGAAYLRREQRGGRGFTRRRSQIHHFLNGGSEKLGRRVDLSPPRWGNAAPEFSLIVENPRRVVVVVIDLFASFLRGFSLSGWRLAASRAPPGLSHPDATRGSECALVWSRHVQR